MSTKTEQWEQQLGVLAGMADAMKQQAFAMRGITKEQSQELLKASDAIVEGIKGIALLMMIEATADEAQPMVFDPNGDEKDGEYATVEIPELGVTLVQPLNAVPGYDDEDVPAQFKVLAAYGLLAMRMMGAAKRLSEHAEAESVRAGFVTAQ